MKSDFLKKMFARSPNAINQISKVCFVMSVLYHIVFFVVLIICTESIYVRITDRKPKWAVKRETSQSPPQKPSFATDTGEKEKSVKEAMMGTSSEPSEDFRSIPISRAIVPFSGNVAKVDLWIGPDVLLPLASVCSPYRTSHYTYYVCPFQYIMQVENKLNGFRGCIG